MSKPIVAIVGRQNVGKSTLLNRLAGKQVAIVEDFPGTTRDRVFATATWQNRGFTLVDTAGIDVELDTQLAHDMKSQIEAAISEADVIVLLVEATGGAIPSDYETANLLRRTRKPVLLAVNKADNLKLEAGAVEFYELGLGEPLPVSAYHGKGTAELMDKIVSLLPPESPPEAEAVLKIAIVGRPHVGKSLLLNALVGKERAIVGEKPGTTRDALDTMVDFRGQNVLIIDTAGIRRRGRVETGIEQYSVLRALRAIDRADVALLVLDATGPVTAQDTHVAGYIQQAAKGIILTMNKWDLVAERNIPEWNKYLAAQFKFVAYAPVLYTSALTGDGVDLIMPMARQIHEERNKRLPTARVNDIIQQAVAAHTLPHLGRKQLKVLYATQPETNPPTFVIFVNDTKLVHFSYRRYIENKLRQAFGFAGTPIRLVWKTRGES
ncbi:MAG: ribosome biogenesis GTPase Der [Dehalococcoidales bacterium]|nr:ribosome biogenesis GTPase Der [Dehalococcoidales bacterium]